jgi:hypothetical protein
LCAFSSVFLWCAFFSVLCLSAMRTRSFSDLMRLVLPFGGAHALFRRLNAS